MYSPMSPYSDWKRSPTIFKSPHFRAIYTIYRNTREYLGKKYHKKQNLLDVTAHNFNSSTWEVEAARFLWVQDQPGLHRKTLSTPDPSKKFIEWGVIAGEVSWYKTMPTWKQEIWLPYHPRKLAGQAWLPPVILVFRKQGPMASWLH